MDGDLKSDILRRFSDRLGQSEIGQAFERL